MSPAQVKALKDLLALEKAYWRKDPKDRVNDHRGLEIGWSVDPRTAKALEDAGLAESINIRTNQNYLFLGRVDPDLDC